VTAIQCDGRDLPNFANARTRTSFTGVFPYAHEVIYACNAGGHRFEDGDTTTTVTCSVTGWAWNHIVTSCGRMLIVYVIVETFALICTTYTHPFIKFQRQNVAVENMKFIVWLNFWLIWCHFLKTWTEDYDVRNTQIVTQAVCWQVWGNRRRGVHWSCFNSI